MQLCQQYLVQRTPHPGLMPVAQPAPAGHARAEAEFLGQELPWDRGVEHEQDPAQRLAVIQPPTAGMPEPALDHRQQRLDPLPQAVLDLPRLRPRHTNPQTDDPTSERDQTTLKIILLGVLTHKPERPSPADLGSSPAMAYLAGYAEGYDADVVKAVDRA